MYFHRVPLSSSLFSLFLYYFCISLSLSSCYLFVLSSEQNSTTTTSILVVVDNSSTTTTTSSLATSSSTVISSTSTTEVPSSTTATATASVSSSSSPTTSTFTEEPIHSSSATSSTTLLETTSSTQATSTTSSSTFTSTTTTSIEESSSTPTTTSSTTTSTTLATSTNESSSTSTSSPSALLTTQSNTSTSETTISTSSSSSSSPSTTTTVTSPTETTTTTKINICSLWTPRSSSASTITNRHQLLSNLSNSAIKTSLDVYTVISAITVYLTSFFPAVFLFSSSSSAMLVSASAATVSSKFGVLHKLSQCQTGKEEEDDQNNAASKRSLILALLATTPVDSFFENPLQIGEVVFGDQISSSSFSQFERCVGEFNPYICNSIPPSFVVRHQVGALVGNFSLIFGVGILQILVAIVHYYIVLKRSSTKSENRTSKERPLLKQGKDHNQEQSLSSSSSWNQSLAFVRFPSLCIPLLALLILPSTSQIILILSYGDDHSIAFASVFLVLLILFIIPFLSVHVFHYFRKMKKKSSSSGQQKSQICFGATFRSMLAVDAARAAKFHKDDEVDLTRWSILSRKGVWFDIPAQYLSTSNQHPEKKGSRNGRNNLVDDNVDDEPFDHLSIPELDALLLQESNRQSHFTRRFGTLFERYKDRRQWWFVLVELPLLLFVGIFEGLSTKVSCTSASVIMLLFSSIYLGLVIFFRPFNFLLEQITSIIITLLLMAAACASIASNSFLNRLVDEEEEHDGGNTKTAFEASILFVTIASTSGLFLVILQTLILITAEVHDTWKERQTSGPSSLSEEKKEQIRRQRRERVKERRMQQLKLELSELMKMKEAAKTGNEDEDAYSESSDVKPWREEDEDEDLLCEEMGLIVPETRKGNNNKNNDDDDDDLMSEDRPHRVNAGGSVTDLSSSTKSAILQENEVEEL